MNYEELIATAIPRYLESKRSDELCEAIIWPTKVLIRIFINDHLTAEATISPAEYKDMRQRFPQLFNP